jgi:hypothetical protein
MGIGAVRVYHQLRIPVNGSESRKKRDELIDFIVRVSCWAHFKTVKVAEIVTVNQHFLNPGKWS